MRTIELSEVEHQLTGLLQSVRNGEEILIADHQVPVARLMPVSQQTQEERRAALVASGALTPPKQQTDRDAFFAIRVGNVPTDVALQAVIDSRGDR